MKFSKVIAAAAILTLAAQPVRAEKAMFSYSDIDEEPAVWGTQGKEYYDVAIHIVQPGLVGMKITGVTVPMFAHEDITELCVWLSSKLEVQNKRHVADIMEVEASIVNDMIDVDFPEGYVIPEEGVYVGYSFNLGSANEQATKKPIALTYGTHPESFYLHTQYNYLKWTDKSSELGGMTMLAVKLEGDIPQVGAKIAYPDEIDVATAAESFTVPVALQSFGGEKVKSVKLLLKSDGTVTDATYEFPDARTLMIGKDYDIEVTFPNRLPAGMTYPSIVVSEINGKENPMLDSDAPQIGLYSYTAHPAKRPIFEEYTGLWCGWCPRGYVGLERMAEEYPDFIGVAVHNDDDMTIIYSSEYPNSVSGLPCGWMDRTVKLSPSYYNIKDLQDQYSQAFTPVDITATADIDRDARVITLSTESNFVRPTNHELRTFRYLLGNGLTDELWMQRNYFYNKSIEDYPDMAQFIDAEQYIKGLVYNDVLIMADFGTKGDFPYGDDLKPGMPIKEEYKFNLDEAMSRTNETLNLADKSSDYSVVFGILDVTDNKVLNAVKVKGVGNTSVDTLEDDGCRVLKTEYYDMYGRVADAAATGLVVKKTVYTDGRTKTVKVLRQ